MNRNEEAAMNLSNYVNAYGYNEKEFAKCICNDHPTLQQSVIRLMIATMREMANKKYFDARNEAAVKASRIMIAALEKEKADGLPLI